MVGGGAAAGPPNDHLHAEGYLVALYYECNHVTPPECWLVSRLNFWISLDLGYRRHAFQGRTAVSKGSGIPWSAWTNKRHRMQCIMGANTCGIVRVVPTGKWWSDRRHYTTTRYPNPGRFRFRATACAAGTYLACGVGRTVSPPIRCDHTNDQCYFDVD